MAVQRTRGRRAYDNKWNIIFRENWYRDLWLLAISTVVAFTALSLLSTQSDVRNGRKFAVGATCAVVSAVSEAGRNIILASGVGFGSKTFLHNLERLGYRPPNKLQASLAARAYVLAISRSVEEQVGIKARDLIQPNGSLNCKEFLRLSNVVYP